MTRVYGPDLVDWYPRHILAMCFQALSLTGSFTIICSFFILKDRRKPFNYQILFLNIADVVWVTSHFINHAEALANDGVTDDYASCATMGMFTHLGIGWELAWLIVIALHTLMVIRSVATQASTKAYEPSRRTIIITLALAWGFPIVWWTIIGLSVDVYDAQSGYFCWVKFTPAWISLLWGDLPLILTCIVVTGCYGYVVYILVKISLDNQKHKASGSSTFRKEIQRAISYVVVYVLWVHSYLIITIVIMSGNAPSRGLFLYFLAMINSMGTFNFFAYGFSERWFADMKKALGCGDGASDSNSTRVKSGSAEVSNTINDQTVVDRTNTHTTDE